MGDFGLDGASNFVGYLTKIYENPFLIGVRLSEIVYFMKLENRDRSDFMRFYNYIFGIF
jgi:hypothetical protein